MEGVGVERIVLGGSIFCLGVFRRRFLFEVLFSECFSCGDIFGKE